MELLAFLELCRQWLAAHRPAAYALLAFVSIIYLFCRQPSNRRPGDPAACRPGGRQPQRTKPRVTVSATGGVLLDSASLAPATGALDAFRRLVDYGDVYVIASEVQSDEEEKQVLKALDAAGLLAVEGFDRRKVLVCSTKLGRVAMCRQIDPEVHVDQAADIATTLAPHLPYVAVIGSTPAHPLGSENIHVASTLQEFVDVYLALRASSRS